VTALLDEAADLAQRWSLEKRERKTVAALDRPTYELDWLPDGVHRGGLFDLAMQLREQGVQ
jgi:hypothetical protein